MAISFCPCVWYARQLESALKNSWSLISLVLAVAAWATPCPAQKNPPAQTIKIKIEANQWDGALALKKLNEHGADHGLRFALADRDYEYRVVFSVGQSTSMMYGSSSSLNSATAEVFDPQGTALFKVFRNNRFSERGVANAISKEVVKRLLKLRQTAKK